MESLKDGSHLYEVERRAQRAAPAGIQELQISKTQKPLEGELRIFLQDPKEEVRLKPGETYTARPKRPHLVTNGGERSATFLILQGIGEYDFVPLVKPK